LYGIGRERCADGGRCTLGAAIALLLVAVLGAAQQEPPAVVRQGQSGSPVALRVAFGGGGRWLAECGGGPVRVFDVATGRVTRALTVPLLHTATCAAHPLADLMAVATANTEIVVVDVATGQERWRTKPIAPTLLFAPEQLALNFSSDGGELFANFIRSPTGVELDGSMSAPKFRTIRPSRSNEPERIVGRWAVEDGRQLELRTIKSGNYLDYSDKQSKVSADGSRELVVLLIEGWRVFDTRSRETFEAPPSTPLATDWAISPDGRLVATVQRDTLILGDLGKSVTYRYRGAGAAGPFVTVEDAMKETRLGGASVSPGEADSVRTFYKAVTPSAAFTSDHRWFVARAQDGQIDVWDTSTGVRMPFRLPAPTSGDHASNRLPIAARSVSQPSAAEGWQPIVVENQAEVVARTGGALCRSSDARFVVEQSSDTDGYARAFLRDRWDDRVSTELLARGFDLGGGCRISPDGARVLVSGVEPQPVRTTTIGRRLFGKDRETDIVVAKASGTAAHRVLRDRRTGRAARFPFGPPTFDWSPDGRFVVVGGDGIRGAFRAWNAGTGFELDLSASGLDRAVRGRFTPGGASLFMRRAGALDVEIWNLDGLARVAAGISRLTTDEDPTNGDVVVSASPDGLLEIRRLATGELLGDLTASRGGDWLVTTPSGFFDGSPGGWQRLAWRTQAGIETAPGELYFDEFYRPGLLAQLLDGRAPGPAVPIGERDRRQPLVRVAAAMAGDRLATVTVDVQESVGGNAAAGSGVRDVRLFRNGSLVNAWRGDQPLEGGARRLEARVAVSAGRNQFTAYAFNRANVKSLDATVAVDAGVPARTPTVYVLAIGVNAYANTAFDLVYARPDAEAFAAELGARQRALGTGAIVRVATLLDREATRANILLALETLAGTGGSLPAGAPPGLRVLAAARPEDSVVLYFAGHGVAQGDRFFLIPSDIAYQGSRADAGAAIPQIVKRGISDLDLERVLEPLDATHVALVIDACQSGQALGAEDGRYGPMNSQGLAQLAYEKGISILAASQAYQAALESARLGHGYLTFALVEEGLKGHAADRTPTDGAVTIEEWFDHAARRVPQLQSEAIDGARQQGRVLRFDTGVARPGESRLQTPRVFTRRHAPRLPFIVARP
jgi:uncharacterized caspase-like protein/WD40 repeat protein